MEYSCPNCSKELIVVSIRSDHFRYKITCNWCGLYEYISNLDEINSAGHRST
jgi:transcription elongation factor Elf1